MEKFLDYIRLSKLEIFKVIFPTKINVRNALIAVLVVVSIISLFLFFIDLLMSFAVSKLI